LYRIATKPGIGSHELDLDQYRQPTLEIIRWTAVARNDASAVERKLQKSNRWGQTMWLRHKPVGAAAGFRGKGRLRAILFVAAQSASHGELRTILPAATEQHTLQRRS
jgi:hypothetical protein